MSFDPPLQASGCVQVGDAAVADPITDSAFDERRGRHFILRQAADAHVDIHVATARDQHKDNRTLFDILLLKRENS